MTFTHYHEFNGLKEVALEISYDYQPEEETVLYPVDDAYEGCAEKAMISSVCMNIRGNLTDITRMITDDFMRELEEFALEDHNQGAEE